MTDTAAYRDMLTALQDRIAFRLHELQRSARTGEMLEPERDGPADTVFAMDAVAEEALDEFLPAYAEEHGLSFTLVTEETGERTYGDDPDHHVICDLVDGSREFGADTASAWIIAGVAPGGPDSTPTLDDVTVAAQTELIAAKQWLGDRYTWTAGGGTERARFAVSASGLQVRDAPSTVPVRDMDHRFWCWCTPFTGDPGPIPRLRTALEDRAGLDTVYPASYISTAGQLAHLATGRYGAVFDLRPLVDATHHARPYDLATARLFAALDVPLYSLVEQDGGYTVEQGVPVAFGIQEPVAWFAYASPAIRDALHPDLVAVLREDGVLDD